VGGKKYPFRTRLDLSQVRMSPMNKKSSPYPSDRVPDGYQIPVPKLPSLVLTNWFYFHVDYTLAAAVNLLARCLLV
jgi:hypothetical protein